MLRCPTCHAAYEREEGMTLCPVDGSALLGEAAESSLEANLDADDSLIGSTLEGGISLVGIAGEGAMGTVYEGWQAQMERRVAVKMLHADLATEADFLQRFIREARAVARLNHPNIVSVHAMGEFDGSPYLVLEYIEGDTVAEVISQGPIEPLRVVRIARQITSALADAHAAKIIHRDLKPSNVILTQRRRASDFVKLLDFGVAKMVDAGATLTRDGFVFGTPAYLSPEQANGAPLDGRSDLYSLGVCMFEMLTKTLPFSGNQVQLLLQHAREPAPLVRDRSNAVPDDLAALVDALLEKEPDDRPASAEVLADMLDSLLGNGASSPWASSAIPLRQVSALAQQAGAASASSESPTRAMPRARGRKPRPLLLAVAGLLLLFAGAGSATLLVPSLLPIHPLASEFRPHLDVALPDQPDLLPDDAILDLDGPREALMFSQDGFAFRISVPAEMKIGIYYEFRIDIWDPDGEPLESGEIIAIFEEPTGERPFPLAPQTEPGSLSLRRRFDESGAYVMKAYPSALDVPIVVHFEVASAEQTDIRSGGDDEAQ